MFARDAKRDGLTQARARALVSVAIEYITRGAPAAARDTVHRLAKVDTTAGLSSVQNAANLHVPYAALLYERYLGRPFASHRDSVSELVGDVMESAIEAQLSRRHITFRKTRRAERIPGFEPAPDFFVPTELAPSVIIEAKIRELGAAPPERTNLRRRLKATLHSSVAEVAPVPTPCQSACSPGAVDGA
jgi:hypothetical protein